MQKSPVTTAVMKLITGRATAAAKPKNAWVTRMESAPVSGAVIRKDMQEDLDAPLRRISATTGTTEQLHNGMGTPAAAAVTTDCRLSWRSHLRMASREMSTWMRPASSRPSSIIGPSSRKDVHRKARNSSAAGITPLSCSCGCRAAAWRIVGIACAVVNRAAGLVAEWLKLLRWIPRFCC